MKLAMLFRPNAVDLHDYLIRKIDFTKFPQELKFEILCLLAISKGTKNATFLSLFS